MRILGITGGVGTGKSKVLSYLEREHNAIIRQLDKVAMELQRKGTPYYREIVEVFGSEVLFPDGSLRRNKVAGIMFADPIKRQKMNQIIHPGVKDLVREDIKKEEELGTSLYVIEAALLIEDNYREICDEIWFIFAEKSVRIQRLAENRGYSKEKIRQIMNVQLTDESFRENSDITIDNSGDFVNTAKEIEVNLSQRIRKNAIV